MQNQFTIKLQNLFEKMYPILFLIGIFFMLAGDFPRFPFGIKERILPLLVISWPKLYLALLCLSFLLYVRQKGVAFERLAALSFLKVPLVALATAFLLSALFSQEKLLAFQAYLYYLGLVLFLIMVCFLIQEKEVRKLLDWIIAFAIAFLSLKVIFWRLEEGFSGAAYHVMNNSWLGKLQIAWVLNIFAPLFFTRFLVEQSRLRYILNGFAWFSVSAAILLLFSRAGTFTFLIITILLCVLHRRHWRRFALLLLIFSLLLVPLIKKGASMTSYVVDTTLQFYEEPGFWRRFGIWKETLRMFLDRPLTGIGLGTYDELAYSQYHTSHDVPDKINWFYRKGWHAHNLFLHLLAETGILGILACGYFCFTIFQYLLARWRQAQSDWSRSHIIALFCSFVAIFFLGMSENLMAVRVHESFRMNLTFWFLVLYLLAWNNEEQYGNKSKT